MLFHSKGHHKNETLHFLKEVIPFLIVVLILLWLGKQGVNNLNYHWQWYRIPQYLYQITEDNHLIAGLLLEGLLVTMKITVWSLFLAFIIGLTSAMMRMSRSIMARLISRVYLEIIRNTPLLIQIFFIYFVIAPVLDMSPFLSAVLALSLFEGAYASEIFRAGITSIAKGQWEAGHSLGLSMPVIYRKIVLPQAIRRVTPPLTGQAISLIKDSALVSSIAIYDLTMQGQAIIADTFLTFEIWFSVAGIYLLLTGSLSMFVQYLESKMVIRSE
jgi:polar amino acid transport system permease protein